MKKTFVSVLATFLLLMMLALPMSAFAANLADGKYAVDYTLSSKTGLQKELIPASLVLKDGKQYVELVFNDAEVDKLYLGDKVILPAREMKSPYRFATGTYQVFNLPLEKVNQDITFTLHTRGNNLVTDDYIINVKDVDPNFDAKAQAEEIKTKNFGAQEYRFYDWHTGMSFSLWGPFLFLAVEGILIAVGIAYFKKKG